MQTETLLNDKVTHGLRAQFSPERVQAILTQAHSMFQESAFRSGNKQPTPAEPYELFEGGWIDQALEYLGFGRWAIGRPKLGNAVHQPKRPAQHGLMAGLVENEKPFDGVELFLRHIPSPGELRVGPAEWSNPIEFRNIMVVGAQGSGKTTSDQALAYGLALKYLNEPIYAAIETASLTGLLHYAPKHACSAYFLVGADLTLAKIPRSTINAFFQIRHLIWDSSGVQRAIVVTSLESHTLHGMDKNLRTDISMIFLKSVPTNRYDRSTLKWYFSPSIVGPLSDFERGHGVDEVLIWDPQYAPNGVRAVVQTPPINVLVPIGGSLSARPLPWWWAVLWRITLLGAITSPLWLFPLVLH